MRPMLKAHVKESTMKSPSTFEISTVKIVVLLGKGLLGSNVLHALADAGFWVTIIGRSENNKHGLPARVKFGIAIYNSIHSLEAALRAQDAIVSTVGVEAIPVQKLISHAAIKASIKRFVPSDFGAWTTNPNAGQFSRDLEMIDIQRYVHIQADAGLLRYTIFSIGALTEFVARNTAKSRFKIACRESGVTHIVAASTTVLTYRISNDRSLPTPYIWVPKGYGAMTSEWEAYCQATD
ncbi:hypothetical protein AG0111_0g9573 [Alternaria gaisen]|uniref:Uncharacterized protein n=1 Tax=Alternaria gaisen TaxID=167740 RepID=A0ACB6FC13_9PLEO|nr:hypothetical protein AG0111_0g9573 [Alternaria gaisen]